MAGPYAPGTVLNLTFHGIGTPPRDLEPGEDRTWISVGQFEQVLDAVVDRSDVRLTFDDGNASDVEIALPRLRRRGLTGEFFLLAGRLGEPGRLDRGQARELCDAGMSVGSHGWAHRDWRSVSAREAHQEVDEAIRVLSELAGRPVRRVAVPFGSYDRRVLARLRRAPIDRVYTSDGGRTAPGSWLQCRTSLHDDVDQGWLERTLDGRPTPAQRIRRRAVGLAKRLRG